MEKRIWQTAGEEVPGQRNMSSWPFRTAYSGVSCVFSCAWSQR